MLKVSVCCITYNHESYIAEAIESVLAQEFDGIIEMVIGEDCSTDRTRAIALAYQKQYPSRVKVLIPASNLGIIPNLIATLAACDGEYIAILDGDDYWIDTTKIQRQVDALRANSDCAFCFHDAETFASSNNSVLWVFSEKYSDILPKINSNYQKYSQFDIAQYGWFIPTASMLFRASSLPRPIPAWFEDIYSGDFMLQLLSTRHGSAIYLPRIMSRYRMHSQSVSSLTAETAYQFERRIFENKMFQQHVFAPEYKKYADISLSVQYFSYARYLGSQGQRWKQLLYLAKAVSYNPKSIPLYLERRLSKLLPPYPSNNRDSKS